jgi:hypothetical protein
MKRFQFSRFALFFYDLARFIVIVAIMTQLGKLSLSDGAYPYFVYASAQALFPIMAWFIYTDAEDYLNYFPLNIAGKIISILLSGIWVFSVFSGMLSSMSYDLFICVGLTFIILFTDIISIVGMAFMKKGLKNSLHDKINAEREKREINSEVDDMIGGM